MFLFWAGQQVTRRGLMKGSIWNRPWLRDCSNLFLIVFGMSRGQFGTSVNASLSPNWHQAKYSHQSKPINVKELKSLALKETRSLDTSFEALLDPILIPRVPGTPNHAKVKHYLKQQMSSLGWDVETDLFQDQTPHGVKKFENIIATLNPDAPRRLVLACHYDSKVAKGYDFIAATDSAVPCAMLLSLAHTLKSQLDAHKKRPGQEVTLQFVFFDGEEAFETWSNVDSIYGARHLAQLWESTPYPPGSNTNYLHRIDMMVLLDLLGTKNPKFYNFFPSTSHWHNLLVTIESAMRKERLFTGKSSRQGSFFQEQRSFSGIEDDHIPFLERGVDIVHVIPTPFPSVWHNERDNKDALDFSTIENLNRVFRAFVASYLHLNETDSGQPGS